MLLWVLELSVRQSPDGTLPELGGRQSEGGQMWHAQRLQSIPCDEANPVTLMFVIFLDSKWNGTFRDL